jgi:hypothetical protein
MTTQNVSLRSASPLLLLVLGACSATNANPNPNPDPDPIANECPEPTGGPTSHGGSITVDQTWTAATSPHVLDYDTSVSAKLTLEPCAIVLIAAKKTVTVTSTGSIVAEGTSTSPVTIDAKETGKPWATIRALRGTLRFVHVIVAGGGDPLNTVTDFAGALDIKGEQTLAPQGMLHAEHVAIVGSASQGIYLHEGGGFTAGSTDVVISGSQGYPINSWANLLGTIPQGTYTGNGRDEILVSTDSAMTRSLTIHDRGVPYRVGAVNSLADFRVGTSPGMPVATLTIEAGVTLRFKKNGVFKVEHFSGTAPASGALIAVGTAAKPIVLTSAEASPAAGDWLGLYFGATPSATNIVDFVVVEYAGGSSSSGSNSCLYPGGSSVHNAAIRFIGSGAPAWAFITNTTIAASAGFGIDRGWRDDEKPSLIPTNTFVDVAGCLETYPKDSDGACPDPVPCP